MTQAKAAPKSPAAKSAPKGQRSTKARVMQVTRQSSASGQMCCMGSASTSGTRAGGLGLDLDLSSSRTILVTGVRAGVVRQCNEKHPPGSLNRLEIGDRIVRVNDVDGTIEMMKILNDTSIRNLKILYNKPVQATNYPELREDLKEKLPEYVIIWRDEANAVLTRDINYSGFWSKNEKKEFWVKVALTGTCEAVPVGLDQSKEARRVIKLVEQVGQREVDRRSHPEPAAPEPEAVKNLWWYNPVNGLDMRAREKPSMEASRTDHKVHPGDVFSVCRELVGADGVLFLELANGGGWLFDQKPGIGVMCERHEGPLPLEGESKRADAADGTSSGASDSTWSLPPDRFCSCNV